MKDLEAWNAVSLPKKDQKTGIYIKINDSVLSWFKKKGKGYQNHINDILESYVKYQKEKKLIDAQKIFKENYAKCFWHFKEDLQVSEENIDIIIDALKKNGGKEEFLLARFLEE